MRRSAAPRSRSLVTTGFFATVALALTSCGGAASESEASIEGGADKLVVWSWGGNSGDSSEEYENQVLDAFSEEHPEVEVELVSQPFDNYYTLLGTSIQSNSGPDVVLFNGGTQIKSRVDALVPLDEYIPEEDRERLTGWDAFSVDGTAYAVPTTMQGFPLYYNKSIYADAGVDAAPETWEELAAACEAIAASEQDASCFGLGNKEQLGIEFFLSGFGPGIFTEEEYQSWLDGDRDWNSEYVRQVFELWKQAYDDGWYNEGVNSTAKFNDEYNLFNAGDVATVVGLASGSANFDVFGEYLGDDLGVFLPPIVNSEVPSTYLPIEGGIGYGVTTWSDSPELAAELALTYANHEPLSTLATDTGTIAPDVTIELETDSQAGSEIISWLPEGKPLLHTALPGPTLDLLHRTATDVLIGNTTIDEALDNLAESDAEG